MRSNMGWIGPWILADTVPMYFKRIPNVADTTSSSLLEGYPTSTDEPNFPFWDAMDEVMGDTTSILDNSEWRNALTNMQFPKSLCGASSSEIDSILFSGIDGGEGISDKGSVSRSHEQHIEALRSWFR